MIRSDALVTGIWWANEPDNFIFKLQNFVLCFMLM